MDKKALESRRKKAIAIYDKLQHSPIPVIYFGAGSCGLAAGAGGG